MTRHSTILIYICSGILFATIIWCFDSKLISLYFSEPFLAGSDGSGHWSIGEYYSTHIFPKTWGWIPIWSGGMPFPQYYPPFFYFFNALLSHLIPWVSYLTITKSLVVGSALLIPTTILWASKKIFQNTSNTPESYIPSILAGLLSILVITTVGGQSSLGFTLESAINKGFVPQFFALIPILLCLGFTATIHTSIISRYGAGIFFLIALLTNVHTALFLAIVICIIATIDIICDLKKQNRISILYTYVLVFGLAGLTSSIWFFPLLATYSYFTTVPLAFDWERIDVSLQIIVSVSFPAATLIAIRRKNHVVLGLLIAVSMIAIAAILKIDQKFPYLPFHMYRWLAISPYLSMLCIAYIVDSIKFKTLHSKITFSLLLLIATGYIYQKEIFTYTDYGIYKNYQKEKVDNLIGMIKKDPGITVIGTDSDLGRNASFIIDAKLGLLNIPTLTHIIRESAPSGLFLTPTRNTFSSVNEMAGVRTYIGKSDAFTKQPIEYRINRAKELGVRYIIASDKEVLGALSTSTLAVLKAKFGPRSLYEIQGYQPKVSVLRNLPTLVFTDLNFKVRPPEELNFTMFNEQALLKNAYPEIYLARDPGRNIDEIPDQELQKFGSLIFTTYAFKDIDIALSKLKSFSTNKKIYAIENKSPIFEKLKILSHQTTNVVIYERKVNTRTRVEEIVSNIFDSLKNNKVPATQVYPYYIRQTYFPWWHKTDGENIYAITPFYTLAFFTTPKTEQEVLLSLVFTTGTSVYIGGLITTVSVCVAGYAILRKKVTPKSK